MAIRKQKRRRLMPTTTGRPTPSGKVAAKAYKAPGRVRKVSGGGAVKLAPKRRRRRRTRIATR